MTEAARRMDSELLVWFSFTYYFFSCSASFVCRIISVLETNERHTIFFGFFLYQFYIVFLCPTNLQLVQKSPRIEGR